MPVDWKTTFGGAHAGNICKIFILKSGMHAIVLSSVYRMLLCYYQDIHYEWTRMHPMSTNVKMDHVLFKVLCEP